MQTIATTLLLLCATLPLAAQPTYFNDGVFDVVDGRAVPRISEELPSGISHSAGVEIVDGAAVFRPALPHRAVTNGSVTITAPTFRLNRLRLDGSEYTGKGDYGGDTLVSPLIRVAPSDSVVLSFSYQRAGKPPGGTYNRGWADTLLVGPEHRVIRNGDHSDIVAVPDRLVVEIVGSTLGTFTMPDSLWQVQRISDGTLLSLEPAFTLYGGGGNRMALEDTTASYAQKLESNLYDAGKDMQFHRVVIPIPSWMLEQTTTSPAVRFRFRVEAADNGAGLLPDDADDFYIDNIQVLTQADSATDLEILAVGVDMPYTIMPERQAVVPISISLVNNGRRMATQVHVTTSIRAEGRDVYSRTTTLPLLFPGAQPLVTFHFYAGDANEQAGIDGRDSVVYDLLVWMEHGPDSANKRNDTLHTTFTLRFGEVFAYDPPFPPEGHSDVPDFAGLMGWGLSLPGTSHGGSNWKAWALGGGNGSGWIGMRFTLVHHDTITGFRSFFANTGMDGLMIDYVLVRDSSGYPGSRPIQGTSIRKHFAYDDLIGDGEWHLEQYVTHLLPQPVALQSGTYWAMVKQSGLEGFHMGASSHRMGMITTNIADGPTPGDGNTTLLIDEAFRTNGLPGTRPNREVFAYINTGEPPVSFMPTTGNPGYAHLDARGTVAGVRTWSRGTWIPLLRPYFGPGIATGVQDSETVPVADIAVHPNPASEAVSVRFRLPGSAPAHTRLTVVNALGRELLRPVDTTLQPGNHVVELSTGSLPDGVYFCRIETGERTVVRRIAVVR